MRRLRRLAATLAAIAATALPAAAGPVSVPQRLNQPISTSGLDQTLFNEAVLLFSNAARSQYGRPPLSVDPGLARAASDHASNMARLRQHSHVLPVRGQSRLQQRMKRQSVSYRLAAENIAMDKVYRLLGRPVSASSRSCSSLIYADTNGVVPIHTYATLAQQVVSRWLASPEHRTSLLSSKFERLGSGAGIDAAGPGCGDVYLVQTFAD